MRGRFVRFRHQLAAGLVLLGLANVPLHAEAAVPQGESAGSPDVAAASGAPVPVAQGDGPASPTPSLDAAPEAPPASWAASELRGEDPLRAALWRAFAQPGPLRERVERLQRAGLAAGVEDLDGPARALLLEPAFGTALERAELAVELAPHLPAAQAALAAAHLDAWQLGHAFRVGREALLVAWDHLEARLWLEANAAAALFAASLGAALGFLGLAAFAAFPRFRRDLARLREIPGPSAAALALALVLLPVALGEGLAGLGLGLMCFALVNGSAWRRLATLAAALLLVAALYPLLERRTESFAALALDPIARAAWATERGTPAASELARVMRAAEGDPLAARAFALLLARQGELDEAARRFAALRLEHGAPDLIANSAAVSLLRGDVEHAIRLYEQAVGSSRSAVLRFNLAQAYGRAIRFDAQDLALSEAQSLDSDVLLDLNRRYDGRDGALVAYLPLGADAVLPRLRDPEAARFLSHALRAPLAPGVLGESRGDALATFLLAAALSLLAGAALARAVGPEQDLYADIARLLQARGGDSMARMAQLEGLRVRQRRVEAAADVAAWLVPGAGGMVASQPLLGLVSVLVFALGAALVWHRDGVVPDPFALGVLPAALGGLLLAGLGITYLLLLALSFVLVRRGRA